MKRLNRRGIWEGLSSMTLGIITFVVLGAVGALVLATFSSNLPSTQAQCASSAFNLTNTAGSFSCVNATNASNLGTVSYVVDSNVSSTLVYGKEGLVNVTSWLPVVVVVSIGAVLIALVAGYFIRKNA